MLAQILPGFRDFRTPLITGVLWLTGIWILFGTPVPKKEDKEGIFGLLNQASDYLTPGLVLGVISFAAYVLGVLLMPDTGRKLDAGSAHLFRLRKLGGWIGKWVPQWIKDRIPQPAKIFLRGPFNDDPYREGHTGASTLVLETMAWQAAKDMDKKDATAISRLVAEEYPPAKEGERRDELQMAVHVIHDRLISEAATSSAALQAQSEKIFNSYDRARSEAEFRFSIHMPIFLIALATAYRTWSSDFLVAVVVAMAGTAVSVILYAKGVFKMNEAVTIASEALSAGAVTSKTITLFRSYYLPAAEGDLK